MLLLGAAVNVVSHPIAFLAIVPLLEEPIGPAGALVVTEACVALGEAALLAWRGVPTTVALSLSGVANIGSLVIGVAIL